MIFNLSMYFKFKLTYNTVGVYKEKTNNYISCIKNNEQSQVIRTLRVKDMFHWQTSYICKDLKFDPSNDKRIS